MDTYRPPTVTRELTHGPLTVDRIESKHSPRAFYAWRLDFGGGFSRTATADNLYDAVTAVAAEAGLIEEDDER